ncbi:hypothetical protein BCI9360_01687 [Bacillus sp. CECT 9360]|nr:hypothetical protein BCI9360_01687 [Bacillus sp. CECT 9360]
MSKKIFKEKEIEILSNNSYVKSVSSIEIIFLVLPSLFLTVLYKGYTLYRQWRFFDFGLSKHIQPNFNS